MFPATEQKEVRTVSQKFIHFLTGLKRIPPPQKTTVPLTNHTPSSTPHTVSLTTAPPTGSTHSLTQTTSLNSHPTKRNEAPITGSPLSLGLQSSSLGQQLASFGHKLSSVSLQSSSIGSHSVSDPQSSLTSSLTPSLSSTPASTSAASSRDSSPPVRLSPDNTQGEDGLASQQAEKLSRQSPDKNGVGASQDTVPLLKVCAQNDVLVPTPSENSSRKSSPDSLSDLSYLPRKSGSHLSNCVAMETEQTLVGDFHSTPSLPLSPLSSSSNLSRARTPDSLRLVNADANDGFARKTSFVSTSNAVDSGSPTDAHLCTQSLSTHTSHIIHTATPSLLTPALHISHTDTPSPTSHISHATTPSPTSHISHATTLSPTSHISRATTPSPSSHILHSHTPSPTSHITHTPLTITDLSRKDLPTTSLAVAEPTLNYTTADTCNREQPLATLTHTETTATNPQTFTTSHEEDRPVEDAVPSSASNGTPKRPNSNTLFLKGCLELNNLDASKTREIRNLMKEGRIIGRTSDVNSAGSDRQLSEEFQGMDYDDVSRTKRSVDQRSLSVEPVLLASTVSSAVGDRDRQTQSLPPNGDPSASGNESVPEAKRIRLTSPLHDSKQQQTSQQMHQQISLEPISCLRQQNTGQQTRQTSYTTSSIQFVNKSSVIANTSSAPVSNSSNKTQTSSINSVRPVCLWENCMR